MFFGCAQWKQAHTSGVDQPIAPHTARAGAQGEGMAHSREHKQS